jgi:diaminopimelate epimerase
MNCRIISADPAGNITIFVLDRIAAGEERTRIAKALLADPALKAEQVGFVIPPPENSSGHWRLEMMGGEFCGNAARSFGLYVARETGLLGPATVTIEISGAAEPLPVRVEPETGRAELLIPKPLATETLEFEGRPLPVYVFEGITHVILPESPAKARHSLPARDLVFALRDKWQAACHSPENGFGLMFWDSRENFMRPAVYVRATDSLIFESSCGSGTAALAAWLSKDLRDGESRHTVTQPGGIIEARVEKQAGAIKAISIGGAVTLSGLIVYSANISPVGNVNGQSRCASSGR